MTQAESLAKKTLMQARRENGNGRLTALPAHRASPAVARVDVGLPAEQNPDDVAVALAGGDVQRGAAVEVDAVDVDAAPQQALDAQRVALAREEEQLHGGVQVLRHAQVLRRRARPHGALAPAAPPVRVHGRLPPEQEPAGGPPRPRGLERRLPPELRVVLHRAPGDLPVQRHLHAVRRHVVRSSLFRYG